MRIRIAAIGWVLLVQMGCSNDDINLKSLNDDPSIATVNGTWEVISYENFIENSVELKNEESLDQIVKFDDSKKPYELSNNGMIMAEFEYSGIRKIRITKYRLIYIYQPVWISKFTSALEGEVTYEINSSRLRFYYDNHSKSVTLLRQ